jgi:ribose transport system permease protein
VSKTTSTDRPANADKPVPVIQRIVRLNEFGVGLALVALIVVIGALQPRFLGPASLLSTLQTASFVAIVAYGMVFILAMTEIDLSVGGIYACSLIAAAKLMGEFGVNPWIAGVIGVGVGALLGALNGALSWLLGLPLIIITLGTLSLYRGLVIVATDAQPVQGIPVNDSFFEMLGGRWFGVPVAAWFAIILMVVLSVLFHKTRFGTMVRAIGSNREAARFSGIPVNRIRLYAITLTGALAGISGILSLAYFEGADPTIGTGFELQVIAAAIIGGTAVSGGSGTVVGALLGALIVAVINSGLVYFQVPTTYTDLITGIVILIAVGSDSLLRKRIGRRIL